jgi:hypothetical protein
VINLLTSVNCRAHVMLFMFSHRKHFVLDLLSGVV